MAKCDQCGKEGADEFDGEWVTVANNILFKADEGELDFTTQVFKYCKKCYWNEEGKGQNE